jgi:octaprenyl-diphosphate synthase
MCGLKTDCLARFAALLGLAAACSGSFKRSLDTWQSRTAIFGAPSVSRPFFQEACNLYGETAEKLGVGFQILDDVRNLDTVPGKKLGDDIVEGKKSLPVILYLRARLKTAGFAAGCFKAAREKGEDAGEIGAFIPPTGLIPRPLGRFFYRQSICFTGIKPV